MSRVVAADTAGAIEVLPPSAPVGSLRAAPSADRDRLGVAYLAGSGHTGSTLLAMFMDAHPQIASVGETSFKPADRRRGTERLCSCGLSYRTCPFWRQVFDSVNADGFRFGPDEWTNDYRYQHPWLHNLLTRYSSNRAARSLQDLAIQVLPFHRARMRAINEVNVSFIRSVLDVARARVFFDTSKRPMRLRSLLTISSLDVRVVRLVRDVRGFASSAKRRGEHVEDAARAWKNSQDVLAHVTQGLGASRMFLLKYEDLCDDPARSLKGLQAFLGVDVLEPPATVAPRDHHILGNKIRRETALQIRAPETWTDRLTALEVARVLRVAGDLNAGLGYQ